MRLTEILDPSCVAVPMRAGDKRGAIEELVDLLAAGGRARDRGRLLAAVLDRETTRTTGIGNGLAIPHGKSDGVTTLVMAVGKPARPIDFQAIDGKPVSLIVLLASPLDQTGPHIQALARISRLMTIDSFRQKLIEADSADKLYQTIRQQESRMGDGH